MKIKVTEKHIALGLAGNAEQCPIALAMIDAGLFHPIVGFGHIYWNTDPIRSIALLRMHKFPTPDLLCRKMQAFDNELYLITPFEFDLEG